MNYPRETIYAALFALGSSLSWTDPSGAQLFQLRSRRMLQWDDPGAGNQPALFQREARETADQQEAFGAPRWKMRAQWWIYLQIPPDEATIPSQYINPLLDAIDALFVLPGQNQTLASQNSNKPLVINALIEGDIIMDDPVYPDQQAVIVVPISMLTGA